MDDIGPGPGRALTDAKAARAAIFHHTRAAIAATPPLENARYKLALSHVDYTGAGEHYTPGELKMARLRGDTASRRLDGTWTLHDKATGAETTRRMVVARVPYYDDEGAFLLGGVRWALAGQLRSLPGAYSRTRPDGVLETAFVPKAGTGRGHKMLFDPKKGSFKLQAGTTTVPLAPVLASLGVTPGEMERHWGVETAHANPASVLSGAAGAKFAAMVGGRPQTGEGPVSVHDVLRGMKFDPWVLHRTLGADVDHGGPETLMLAAAKLKRMARGEEGPDDRSSLAFLSVHGPEHVVAERASKDLALLRQVFRKMSIGGGGLDKMRSGVFTTPLLSAIRESGLGQTSEETNPLSLVDQQSRLTRMGVGGIGSSEAVPMDARSVHPSQLGFVDPIVTPENMSAGVDLRGAEGARLVDGELRARFHDARTRRPVWLSPRDLHDAVTAFPGELKPGKKWVRGIKKGKLDYVEAREVDYVLPNMESAFSPLSNLVPLKSGAKGQRLSMGVRFLSQALPLTHGEAPYVQAAIPGGGGVSYERAYAPMAGAAFAPEAGRVLSVSPEALMLEGAHGVHTLPLVTHAPYNRKTGAHWEPLVKPGEEVSAGQPIVKSNYTDATGHIALGRNARVAMLPGFGPYSNYEDAFVIGKSFGDKLTSDHYYQHALDKDDAPRQGRTSYISRFPARFTREQLANIDVDGAVKPGTVLAKGDPIALGFALRAPSRARVFRGPGESADDRALVWGHDEPGVVTNVVRTGRGPRIVTRTALPMRVGDKLANRYGAKGVISSIVPDDEMPRTADGKPIDVLYNPAMTNSRVNPAAILEMALGKIAEHTGKPIVAPDYDGGSSVRRVVDMLKAHGLPFREHVVDPATGRKIKTFVGNGFFMKLHHMAEAKLHGRGIGGYTAEGTPAKGVGDESSKRMSLGEVTALLSSGASATIRDALQVRGQASPQFWARFMGGHDMPVPAEPVVHRKFLAQLATAGIHAVRRNGRIDVMALTNDDIDRMAAGRVVNDGRTVDFEKGLRPYPGGLFDPAATGGHGGGLWSKMRLAEPMPNPVMESPVRHVLGLTTARFRDVIAGKEALDGVTGPAAIPAALARIDLPREIAATRAKVKLSKGGARDAAVKKLGYLMGAETAGLHPADWVWKSAPVLPPIFRPVSVMRGSGSPLVNSANVLYGELWRANRNLADLRGKVADVGPERLAAYDALKAVAGLGKPVHADTARKEIKGALAEIVGPTAKLGTVQRKLLSSNVDMVGRSVVVPDPDLDMDEIGIPEAKLFDVYKPFIVRRLVRSGMDRVAAVRAVEAKSPEATRAALAETEARPIQLSRAPVLHRYGIMAFKPKPVVGEVMRVNPFVTAGLNMDFDGDMANFHVPVTDEAASEALEKLLPSKHLLSGAEFRAHQLPQREHALGLYFAGKPAAPGPPVMFATAQDAINAYHDGEIPLDQPVRILGQ